MNNRIFNLLWIAILAAMVSCNSRTAKNNEQSPDPLVSHIDSTKKSGDDFFLFANGKWFKEHPIPASEQSNGLWQLIQDTINAQIRNVCESSAALTNAAKGSNKQKIGDFFFTVTPLRVTRSGRIGWARATRFCTSTWAMFRSIPSLNVTVSV